MERDLRRLQLLVSRAAADCGGWHPEFRELDALLRLENVETERLHPLLRNIERPAPNDPDSGKCSIIRHNIAVELRDFLATEHALTR